MILFLDVSIFDVTNSDTRNSKFPVDNFSFSTSLIYVKMILNLIINKNHTTNSCNMFKLTYIWESFNSISTRIYFRTQLIMQWSSEYFKTWVSENCVVNVLTMFNDLFSMREAYFSDDRNRSIIDNVNDAISGIVSLFVFFRFTVITFSRI